jgi:hypothetical protein
MYETLIGGAIGGIFRIIPECLKFFDAKNERAHELDMQKEAYRLQELSGKQKMDEIAAESQSAWNKGAIDALKTAIKGQHVQTGVKWVDGFTGLMRPLITFQWVVVLYPGVIVFTFVMSIHAGTPVLDALRTIFGPDEKALVAGILNFWFLGRVFDKVK